MFKYGFTEFGKDVKKRLIDLDKSQEWLISQLNRDTGLFVDSSYLNRILTGRCNSEKIIASISKILDLQGSKKGREKMRAFDGVSTRDLVEELRQREGVETTIAEPHKDTEIKVNGPAIVLVVID